MKGYFPIIIILNFLLSLRATDVQISCKIDQHQCDFYFTEIEAFHEEIQITNGFNENITNIHFIFSKLRKIPPEIFQTFPKLETLFIKSVGLTKIDLEKHEAGSLGTLQAEYNFVTILEENLFLGARNLETINLRHNKIDFLTPDAFYGLANLKKLHLSYNKIQALDQRVFQPLKSMTNLHLNGNKIEQLSKDLFIENLNLKILHLESNRIISICNGTFRNLNLKILYLNDNDCISSDIFLNPLKNQTQLNERLGNCYKKMSLFWRGKIVSITLEVLCCSNFVFGVITIIVILVKRRKKKRITIGHTERGISIIARPY